MVKYGQMTVTLKKYMILRKEWIFRWKNGGHCERRPTLKSNKKRMILTFSSSKHDVNWIYRYCFILDCNFVCIKAKMIELLPFFKRKHNFVCWQFTRQQTVPFHRPDWLRFFAEVDNFQSACGHADSSFR